MNITGIRHVAALTESIHCTVNGIPLVVTVSPREFTRERSEEIEEAEGYDDVVIQGDQKTHSHHGVAET